MKLYLAVINKDLAKPNMKECAYTLISFFYVQKFRKLKRNQGKPFPLHLFNDTNHILIDSGAFSFMNGKQITLEEMEQFLEEYIQFIIDHDIKYFLEMDVDAIFGYKKVLEFREKLETRTGKKCIPVWHKSRGKDDFIKMCQNYEYAAIGGIVTKEIPKKEWNIFPKLNAMAKSYGCKLHGLGFTPSIASELLSYGFYSCDSSTWTMSERFPQFHVFQNDRIKNRPDLLKDRRKKNHEQLSTHQFGEWIKYQQYLRKITGEKN